VLADQNPPAKVAAVRSETRRGTTVMVGDGVNDAPALASADVGVAMGARGATASSEAADVVITVDRLDRLAETVRIARRSRSIALQSVVVGMGLSLLAMAVAAAGLLPPVQGAFLQEGIDVLVILNALRAVGGGASRAVERDGLPARMAGEHRRLWGGLEALLEVADSLDRVSPLEARRRLVAVQDFLVSTLLPHEASDETALYPLVAQAIGGRRPTEVMAREHAEIRGLVGQLGELISGLPPDGPGEQDLPDLRRVLYGLHAILRLHFAQEDQSYIPLLDAGGS
jgi:hemerythrin-like domain-containing protein